MNIQANATGRKGSVFQSCSKITLQPDGKDEAEFLALMARVLTSGGTITITKTDGDFTTMKFEKDGV